VYQTGEVYARSFVITEGLFSSVLRQKYLYKPFVVSLSNHRRNGLKTLPLRLAQGERNL